MGVGNDKSRRLHLLVKHAPVVRHSICLTEEEWHMVERLTASIAESIAQAIEQQSYVTQNVLEYTMAELVAMVLKLNCDIFGKVGGEAEHMSVLIRRVWREIENIQVGYENT